MAIRFEISSRASRTLAALDERWSKQHGAAPNPLFDEIDHAVSLLVENPGLGVACGRSS